MKNNVKLKKKTAPPQKKNKFVIGVIAVLAVCFLFYIIFSNINVERKTEQEKPNTENGSIAFKKQGEVSFLGNDGNFKTRIDVEIADTEYKRNLGLMYRDKMEEYQGMLFIFPEEDMLAFWMKNTILTLDIIFIDRNYKIINIHKNTKPYSEQTYPADALAQYVVEVNAGFADAHNLQKGDKINWRAANN
ncbi:MAG TPA: DUF192 domain-containing protein [Ignavibacteriales bacterium]|nr:DUF192 domain-containing protein [Ignavibacteriales bacterium]